MGNVLRVGLALVTLFSAPVAYACDKTTNNPPPETKYKQLSLSYKPGHHDPLDMREVFNLRQGPPEVNVNYGSDWIIDLIKKNSLPGFVKHREWDNQRGCYVGILEVYMPHITDPTIVAGDARASRGALGDILSHYLACQYDIPHRNVPVFK